MCSQRLWGCRSLLTSRCPPEAAERRFAGAWGSLLPEGPGGRPAAEAFHCRLRGPVQVDEKTLVELQGFQAVSVRGPGAWPLDRTPPLRPGPLPHQAGVVCPWGPFRPADARGALVGAAGCGRPALQPDAPLPSLQPTAQGAFLRGSGLSLASGRFTAPVTAIFQFSASLHVGERGGPA